MRSARQNDLKHTKKKILIFCKKKLKFFWLTVTIRIFFFLFSFLMFICSAGNVSYQQLTEDKGIKVQMIVYWTQIENRKAHIMAEEIAFLNYSLSKILLLQFATFEKTVRSSHAFQNLSDSVLRSNKWEKIHA